MYFTTINFPIGNFTKTLVIIKNSSILSLVILPIRLYNFRMSLPFKYFRLQKIDNQLDQLTTQLHAIQFKLDDHSLLNNSAEKLSMTEKSFKEATNNLRNAEHEVQQQKIKIEQSESSLYSGKIKNPKELKDLENEVISLQKYLVVLEDRLLERMMDHDEKSSTHNDAKNEYDVINLSETNKFNDLVTQKGQIEQEIFRIKKDREVACNSLSGEEIKLYEQLRKTRRGVAVAQVVDKTCSACGSTLSKTLLQSAFSMSQISFCDTCGRILYGGQ